MKNDCRNQGWFGKFQRRSIQKRRNQRQNGGDKTCKDFKDGTPPREILSEKRRHCNWRDKQNFQPIKIA
ncbi:MAG TPA: hypothetical protein DEB39_05430 [Planctomycetaceae bacterium]|nr:hypothetical protein [Planctomycetaceae bacterium]